MARRLRTTQQNKEALDLLRIFCPRIIITYVHGPFRLRDDKDELEKVWTLPKLRCFCRLTVKPCTRTPLNAILNAKTNASSLLKSSRCTVWSNIKRNQWKTFLFRPHFFPSRRRNCFLLEKLPLNNQSKNVRRW